jgi:hypothetical protein
MFARFRSLSTDHSRVAAHLEGRPLGAQVDDSNRGRLTHRLVVSHEQHRRTLAGCLHNSSQLFPRHSVEGLVVDHADVCPDPVLVNGQGYLERPPPCRLVAELGPH